MNTSKPIDAPIPVATDRATQQTRSRYDRLAPYFDRFEAGIEARRFRKWRTLLWNRATGEEVLELGVGTGKNFPFYRPEWSVTAIDLSPRMLEQAKQRAQREHVKVQLLPADAQSLPFPSARFDTIVGTFVFCSVPDPIRGLCEARRVLRPTGQLLLLEHVRSNQPLLRLAMNLMNPVMVRLTGANMNRETVRNVELAGFSGVDTEELWGDVVRLIEVRS